MLHKKSRIYTIVILLIVSASFVRSQVSRPLLPEVSEEQLYLFSDRGFYCVGENILFSASCSIDRSTGLSEWSKVLYVELIEWSGKQISSVKVPISEGLASGKLGIPGELSSGNYYLRAYTKWMRNYSPYLYSYVPVKIINPYIKEVEKGKKDEPEYSKLILVNEKPINDGFIISGLQPEYGCRKLVEFEIEPADRYLSGMYVLSIARKMSNDNSFSSLGIDPGSSINDSIDELRFLPETRTITLEGKTVENISKIPVQGREVVLCSMLDPLYFFVTRTNERGNFHFSIPYYEGMHQFCLTSLYGKTDDLQFLIENDFCSRDISLPYVPFELNEYEQSVARDIVINTQISNLYSGSEMESDSAGLIPFYGSPQNTIVISDYIQLGELREFLFELVPDLIIKGRNNESHIEFEKQSSLSIFPPLILMDNIPVPNNDELLSIPSSSIERIELIGGGYIINDRMFSGLICMYSKEGDLAGIDLKGGNQYFELQLFTPGNSYELIRKEYPRYRVADMRNLLYYNPDLTFDTGKPTSIHFYTGDAMGGYTVTLKGVSENGEPVLFNQYDFTVQ